MSTAVVYTLQIEITLTKHLPQHIMSVTTDHTKHNKGDKTTLGDMFTDLTPGVKNIRAAYSRAGATNYHTPGAASKLGSQEQQGGNETPLYRGEDKAKDDGKEVLC
jgi:hypothetical protein